MAIEVVGRVVARRYRINCTDETCRAILEFDCSDVGYNSVYSMGREVGQYRGIVCPDCDQVLKFEDAEGID